MGQSRRPRKYRPQIDCCALALIASCLTPVSAFSQTAPPITPSVTVPKELEVQLDVSINGEPAHLIGAFNLVNESRLTTTRAELAELGIIAPGNGPAEERIELTSIPTLTYQFDPISQSIDLHINNSQRIKKIFSASQISERYASEASKGMVINYTAFAEASHDIKARRTTINGGSVSLDGRAYSKYGTLNQSGIIGTTTFTDATALRLDTVLSFADEDNIATTV